MKKFIQIVSFLALALVFGGISANAQSATKIDAKVPFDFIVGDRYFAAGEYVIRLVGSPAGAKQVEVRDKAGETVYTLLAVGNGDTGHGRSELVFERTEGKVVLTKILTGDAGYSVPVVDTTKLGAASN